MKEIIKNTKKQLFKYKITFIIFYLFEMILNFTIVFNIRDVINILTLKNDSDINDKIKLIFIQILFLTIFSFVEQYVFRLLQYRGEFELQNNMYNFLLKKNPTFFINREISKIISNFNNDLKEISFWISSGSITLLIQFLILISNLFVIFILNKKIFFIIIIFLFICFILNNKISNKISKFNVQYQNKLENINSIFYIILTNIKLIIQLKKRTYFYNLIKKEIKENKFYQKISIFNSIQSLIFDFLVTFLPLTIIFISLFFIDEGNNLNFGTITSIMFFTSRLNEPIIILGDLIVDKKTFIEICEKLQNIYSKKDNFNKLENLNKIKKFENLKFQLENFSYENSNLKILKNINFELKKGEILILKGKSGVGKSTIANLISRFLNFENGEILYNNIDINKLNLEEYYNHILQLEQNSIILNDTIKENLVLGDKYTENEIQEVINTFCLDEMIEKYGLNYKLEQNGQNISGGEKQRINLARIFLRKSEVLILDEPLNGINEAMAEEIVLNIYKFIKKYDMSLIIISHDNFFDTISEKIINF